MNYKILCTFILCTSVIVLLTGCRSGNRPFIPDTGTENASIPSDVELVRDNVLAYVVSYAHFETFPLDGNWQLEAGESPDGKYRFHNGDWTVFVWGTHMQKENHRVAVSNKAIKAFWCGYVTPKGHVVDTTYMP